MSATVNLRDEDSIRIFTLNRPNKLNAMNTALVDELSAALSDADRDPNVAVILIHGAGRAFCAGADLSGSEQAPGKAQVAATVNHSIDFYQLLVAMNTPMIAAVHGYALGGGCNLAISCDLVVSANDAVFGYPEVKLGMPAAGVAPPLVHQIGRKAASELLLLCENIDASQALERGLVNRLVKPEQVFETALSMARQLKGYSNHAVQMTKQLIRRSAEQGLCPALETGRDIGLAANIYAED